MALIGLGFQIILAISFIFLWRYSLSEAVHALGYLTGAGVWIWLALVLIYHQRALVQDEAFETEQLKRERGAGLGGDALFDVAGEQLLLARRRLAWMYRYILPVFTVVIVAGLTWSALLGWAWGFGESFSSTRWPEIQNLESGMLIWVIGGIAFVSFLFSRYVIGMSRYPEWKMLRAGSSYLMGVTLTSVATAAVLAVVYFSKNEALVPEHVLAYVLRLLMLLLAAELVLNFVLDFYRPRSPEEEPRPAFDSRLLGLFSEPGGIARSIADAMNYQFGFDVSSTWFYQLLQRSVVPLLGFAVLTLFAASSLVFVNAGEEAVIEHYGQKRAVLEPGIHVKWPWPIDIAHRVGTSRVHELKIGIEESKAPAREDELILWTNRHSQEPHLMVLVATPKLASFLGSTEARVGATRPATETPATQPAGERGKAVPVSMLRVAATIQFKIRNAWDWLTQHDEPEKVLQSIANREIMRHCASADVIGLMGPDRKRIEAAIQDSIQKAADADNVKLGVEIVFFGLQGVHPPEDTAADFQKVIGAELEKTATIKNAEAESNKKLTEVAGDVTRARELAEAIARLNRLEADTAAPAQDRAAARERVETLFVGRSDQGVPAVGGQAAIRVAEARARRWKLENEAQAEAVAFEQAMATKNAAPRVFQMRRYLETLAGSMSKARKYVIAAQGRHELPIFQLNFQDAMNAPLDVSLETPK